MIEDLEQFGIKTVASAAEFLGLSISTVRNEIRHGRLRARKSGSKVLITHGDLFEYINSLEPWRPGHAPTAANEARRGSTGGE